MTCVVLVGLAIVNAAALAFAEFVRARARRRRVIVSYVPRSLGRWGDIAFGQFNAGSALIVDDASEGP